MKTRKLQISELSPYHKNARRGDVDAIADSLQVNGQYKPIIVNEGTLTGRPWEVLVGNHTVEAAGKIGLDRLDAVVIDVDDEAARRIVLVDNRTSDLATYDDALLADLLGEADLAGTGLSDVDLDHLIASTAPPVEVDEDDAPAPPEDPVTQEGDVWLLGKHRLVCGDSTSEDVWAALMGDEVADAMWTDPPYGVEYVGKTKDALTIQNDGAAGLSSLLAGSFTQAAAHLKPGAPFYIAHADSERITFETQAREAGLQVRQNLVWVKNSLVMGRSDYHYKHEPILYGFREGGDGRLGRGGKRWFGDNAQTTVLEFDRPTRSAEHPTMKPVALVEYCLNNSMPRRGIVLEPFGGSGSTLVACEQTGRAARVIELDPRFCDVIVRRWEQLTGLTAQKETK